MVAHGFSAKSLQHFEPYIDGIMAKFLRKIDEFAGTQQPFDIYFWFELFTMDLMGELALGSTFGTIEAKDPETGEQMDFIELGAETSLM